MPPKLVISPMAPPDKSNDVALNVEEIHGDDVPGTDESDVDSDVESVIDPGDIGSENSDVDGEDNEDESDGSDNVGSDSEEDGDDDEAGGETDDESTSSSKRKVSSRATAPGNVHTELANLPSELQELAEQLAPTGDLESSDDDDWSDRLEQSGLLAENGVPGDALLNEHPEAAIANVDEVRAAANVIRDSSGEIIDPYHTTTPIITRYEYAKVIGLRAEQISAGGMPAIQLPHEGMNARDIAIAEYKAKAIPFIIRRPLPSGKSEYWRIRDLIDVSY